MILHSFQLSGKNALVTGSSKGIGAAIVVALAEAGAVAVHGNSTPVDTVLSRVQKIGVNALALHGDVANPEVCHELVERTVRQFGSIDILVNNAGIIRRCPAESFSAEDWRKVIDVNLNSVFRLSQLAARHMLNHGNGKIINIIVHLDCPKSKARTVRRCVEPESLSNR